MPTTTVPAPRLHTLPEVAAHLRISRTQLYNLLDRGELPSFHIGRSRRITAEALDAFIAAHQEKA